MAFRRCGQSYARIDAFPNARGSALQIACNVIKNSGERHPKFHLCSTFAPLEFLLSVGADPKARPGGVESAAAAAHCRENRDVGRASKHGARYARVPTAPATQGGPGRAMRGQDVPGGGVARDEARSHFAHQEMCVVSAPSPPVPLRLGASVCKLPREEGRCTAAPARLVPVSIQEGQDV